MTCARFWFVAAQHRGLTDRRFLTPAALALQAILVGGAAAIFQALQGGAAASAVLYGGGIALVNVLLLGWRAHRADRAGALTARQSLAVVYLSAVERFLAVAALFALGIGVLELAALPLLIGFVSGLPALLLMGRAQRG